jgi:hypothetical protein
MNNLYHPDSIFNDFSLKEMKNILLSIPEKLAHENKERLALSEAINRRDEYELLEFEDENAQILFSFLIDTLKNRTEIKRRPGTRSGKDDELNFLSSLKKREFNNENNLDFIKTVCIGGLYSNLPEVKKYWKRMIQDITRFNKPTGDPEKDHINGLIYDELRESNNKMMFNNWNALIDINLSLRAIHELRVFQKIKKNVDQNLVSEVIAYEEEVSEQYEKISPTSDYDIFLREEKENKWKETTMANDLIQIRGEDVVKKAEVIKQKVKNKQILSPKIQTETQIDHIEKPIQIKTIEGKKYLTYRDWVSKNLTATQVLILERLLQNYDPNKGIFNAVDVYHLSEKATNYKNGKPIESRKVTNDRPNLNRNITGLRKKLHKDISISDENTKEGATGRVIRINQE